MIHVSHHFYVAVSGILFFLVGVAHGLRTFYGWELVFNGWMVPLWVSWLVVLIGFLMALGAVKHMR